jgi:hypothetical protein
MSISRGARGIYPRTVGAVSHFLFHILVPGCRMCQEVYFLEYEKLEILKGLAR